MPYGRKSMEDYLKYRFALEMLRQAGFTAKQIDEFRRLRRTYAERQAMDHILIDCHRLEFARWLMIHGKLTEEVMRA